MPVCASIVASHPKAVSLARRPLRGTCAKLRRHGPHSHRSCRRGTSSLPAVLLFALFVLLAGLAVSITCVVTVRDRIEQRNSATNSATEDALSGAGIESADDDRNRPVAKGAQR